jgi:hypothetical protein
MVAILGEEEAVQHEQAGTALPTTTPRVDEPRSREEEDDGDEAQQRT